MDAKLNPRHILLISLSAALVYCNSLRINFLWDDAALILDNHLIRGLSNIFRLFSSPVSAYTDKFYRPLQSLSFIFDYRLYGLDPRGWHITNIALHILAAAAAYKLILLLTKDARASFCSVLLYTVCPLWVEAVSYISGRADILMGIFIMLSLIFFIRGRFFLSVLFYASALLSKEAALCYPFVTLLYVYLFGRKGRAQAFAVLIIFAVSLTYAALRLIIMPEALNLSSGFPLFTRMAIFIESAAKYIFMIFLPINQHMGYGAGPSPRLLDARFLVSLSACAGLVFLYFYYARKEKALAFFIGWFFIMLFPYSGIFPINAFFSEHFAYLASLGIFVNFAYFLSRLKSRAFYNAVFFGYLIFFSLATLRYNSIWQDPVKLYERVIRFSPGNIDAYNNLAVIYLDKGELAKAESLIHKAIGIGPEAPEPRLNLARFYYFKNDYPRAIGLAKAVLEKDPRNFMALNYLGSFYFKNNEPGPAEDYFKRAVKENPRLLSLRGDLYLFYRKVNRNKEAEQAAKEIGGLDRDYLSMVYLNEARELFYARKPDEALEAAERGIGTGGRNSGFYNLKGCILKDTGNYREALDVFTQGLAISPRDFEIYNNMGSLFALTGDLKGAEACFKKAVSLSPGSGLALLNLGLFYYQSGDYRKAGEFLRRAAAISGSRDSANAYLRKISVERQ